MKTLHHSHRRASQQRPWLMFVAMGLVSVMAVGVLLFWQPGVNSTRGEPTIAPEVATVKVELSPTERTYLESLGPITVAPDPDWIPYEFIDEQGKFVGIAADMFDLLAERLDIEFAYVIARDWDQAIELSQAGEVYLLPFLNQTPAREEWLIFTEPLLVDPNVFITREEHSFIFDATQLSDTTIVLPSGTSVEERVRRDFPNLTVVTVPSENEVFQAVSNREADLTLRSLTIAAYTIRKEGLFNLKIAGQAPDSYVNRLRIGVLKDERMLRDILDKGIATITPREREAIINRHVNITIVQPFDYSLLLRIAGVLAVLAGIWFYWSMRLRTINASLRESERSKSLLIANLPGVAYRCRFDHDWTMEFVSEGCFKLTGYPSEALVNNRLVSFNDLINPEDRERVWTRWEEASHQCASVQLEYRLITADQREKWIFEQGAFVCDATGTIQTIEGLLIDITDRKQAEEEVYRVSIHDDLTGIYNRRYIFERLQKLMKEYERNCRAFAIALIDLDFFKTVNDTYGHQGGDYVLQQFAQLLSSSCRPYDLVGRYGGEEFIVIALNLDHEAMGCLMKRVRERLDEQAFVFEGQRITVTFSAGIAASSETGVGFSIETLISQADRRLYDAKELGRDRII
ncbi:diguanylate cyclase [Candidatus Chloroploca sp. M-50]|uniref:Diguanylate cyclase n=1 Tax=Candidatus Chloroploca mongolica TaxID=2528176 RepID=A0ABS4DAC6_9CHLR|nr:diguanylate cyclase [Candidatus Chloroploca mongolica]MBP1466393.1 diguanylate cyclase [Candidatus Chloroploca mongolica]